MKNFIIIFSILDKTQSDLTGQQIGKLSVIPIVMATALSVDAVTRIAILSRF